MQISEREKAFLGFGAVFLVGLGLVTGFRFLQGFIQELDQSFNSISRENQEITALAQEYQNLKNVKSVGDDSQLNNMVPYIENMLNQLSLREKVRNLSPRDSVIDGKYVKKTVTISFREVSSRDFLSLVQRIESDRRNLLKVDSLTARPISKKTGFYNVNLEIAGFKKR